MFWRSQSANDCVRGGLIPEKHCLLQTDEPWKNCLLLQLALKASQKHWSKYRLSYIESLPRRWQTQSIQWSTSVEAWGGQVLFCHFRKIEVGKTSSKIICTHVANLGFLRLCTDLGPKNKNIQLNPPGLCEANTLWSAAKMRNCWNVYSLLGLKGKLCYMDVPWHNSD